MPQRGPPGAHVLLAHLRTIRSQLGDVEPLSQAQRKQVRRRLRVLPQPVVEASINVIGVLDNVSQAIGQPLDQVRRLQDETLRWDAVVDEARAFLKAVQGANLMRRQQLAVIAAQAYTIGTPAGEGSGEVGARAARRGGQTAERRGASQEGDAGPSTAGAAAGRRPVYDGESVTAGYGKCA